MTETEKLLLNALERLQNEHSATVNTLISQLEQLQAMHGATVNALTSRMHKLEESCGQLALTQREQGELLRRMGNDRAELEQLLQDWAQSLSALRRL